MPRGKNPPADPAAANQETSDAVRALVPDADVDAMIACFTVIRAAERLQQDFEVSVHRPAGLTWAAFRNLFALLTLGPQTPLQLSRLQSVSQASTSSIVKTLLKYGLVTRENSAHDGRSVTISLTPLGTKTCLELFRRNNQREIAWIKALREDERVNLVALLNKIRDHHVPPPETPAGDRPLSF
jgi:DNA-binding MarR family transcriptional regulator